MRTHTTKQSRGKFTAGKDCRIGEGITIDVDEEVVVGDRCIVPNNTYFGGRRVEIGDDFFGYEHWNRRLEIGLGRRDEEHAVLKVGSRCTFHDNRIDLSWSVTIGDDVGLSPEVAIYTHGYWQSPLDGYPMQRRAVRVGNGAIIGFRSVLLPGSIVAGNAVVGAGSVVAGHLSEPAVYGGNPAKIIRSIVEPSLLEKEEIATDILSFYLRSCNYRGIRPTWLWDYPILKYRGARLNLAERTIIGDEDEYTDDLREFLFKHGIRIYTKRPFKRLELA